MRRLMIIFLNSHQFYDRALDHCPNGMQYHLLLRAHLQARHAQRRFLQASRVKYYEFRFSLYTVELHSF
jgi:hypothetical protein